MLPPPWLARPAIEATVFVDVSLENEGMFQEIQVNPSVNFNRLEEVQVQIEKTENAS